MSDEDFKKEVAVEVKGKIVKNGRNDGGKKMDGHFINKNSLWFVLGGAVGALAAVGIVKASEKIKPALVEAVKEGYAFKEWAATKLKTVSEDLEDIAAEAKHAYYRGLKASTEAVEKEKEILKKVEEKIEKKSKKGTTKKGGK